MGNAIAGAFPILVLGCCIHWHEKKLLKLKDAVWLVLLVALYASGSYLYLLSDLWEKVQRISPLKA